MHIKKMIAWGCLSFFLIFCCLIIGAIIYKFKMQTTLTQCARIRYEIVKQIEEYNNKSNKYPDNINEMLVKIENAPPLIVKSNANTFINNWGNPIIFKYKNSDDAITLVIISPIIRSSAIYHEMRYDKNKKGWECLGFKKINIHDSRYTSDLE